MCIIMYKPVGADLHKDWKEHLQTMSSSNKDGTGVMFAYENKLFIDKGYFKVSKVIKRIEKIASVIDLKTIPLAVHCRIATSGTVDNKTCHPFPIVQKVSKMGSLQPMYHEAALMHNGILHSFDMSTSRNYCDSQYLAKALSAVDLDRMMNEPEVGLMVKEIASPSRLLIMDKFGRVLRIGAWDKDDETYFSNGGYKTYTARTGWTRQPIGGANHYGYGYHYMKGNYGGPISGGMDKGWKTMKLTTHKETKAIEPKKSSSKPVTKDDDETKLFVARDRLHEDLTYARAYVDYFCGDVCYCCDQWAESENIIVKLTAGNNIIKICRDCDEVFQTKTIIDLMRGYDEEVEEGEVPREWWETEWDIPQDNKTTVFDDASVSVPDVDKKGV